MGSIVVEWDDDTQRTIRLTYRGAWSLEDYAQAEIEASSFVASVTHRVCVIGDLRESDAIPQGGLLRIAKAYADAPPNLDITVIVGADWLHEALLTALKRVTPPDVSTIYFVNTLEEARALIKRYLDDKGNTAPGA